MNSSILLTEIDFKEINEKPVIYQIRNTITGRVFISATMNFKKHLKGMISNLEKAQSRNPEQMNIDYRAYGASSFVVEILRKRSITEVNITSLKNGFVKSANRLYNIKTDLWGGGYESLSEPCYLLSLNGEIVESFPSIQSAFNHLGITPHYSGKNTQSVVDGKYRVVTQEFYKYHRAEIKRWPHYTDLTKYMSEVYKKSTEISAIIDGEKKIFKNVTEISNEIKKTKEAVRLILRGETKSNPLKISYINEDARKEFKELKELKDRERNRKRIERKLRKMAT